MFNMTSSTHPCKQIRLAVLGAAGVGKSAMIVRFITGRFLHHYDPTLEDEYSVETEVEGHKCNVSILDTAGVNSGNSNHYYLRMVDAIMIVFSLEDQSSLDVAKQLLQNLQSQNLKQLPVVLVGTKCDLHSHQRILSYNDALTIAKEFGSTYVETSSAVNINILEAFQTAMKVVIMQQAEMTDKCIAMVKKQPNPNNQRVRRFLFRLNPFKKEKKLLESLAVSFEMNDPYLNMITSCQ